MSRRSSAKSPFDIPNVRRFIAFRVFFNARFYYPVFTILFLDFGLTIEEFALLNAVWAAAIVLLEVPSGALADVIGRKKLLAGAGGIMVIEIGLLCFVPLGNHALLFAAFVLNRILSGAAEAAASGADEAIAYDSLKAEGDPEDWGKVLERQMRLKSIAYIGAMSLGALVYDPAALQKILNAVGLNATLTQETTLRFPLYLTLVMAVLTFITVLRMTETEEKKTDQECTEMEACRKSVADAFHMTFQAGAWILRTPFALVVITAGLLFDHIIRMLVTLNSQYFRMIDLPEASFGLIGSGLAVLGIFVPQLALMLANRRSAKFNLGVVSALTLAGLIGMTFFWPIVGLVPVILLYAAIQMVAFFVSHYLNRITASHQRATVLSFKGLSFNLAYGGVGLLYSWTVAVLKSDVAEAHPQLSQAAVEKTGFMASIGLFPWYFGLAWAAFMLFAWRRLRSP